MILLPIAELQLFFILDQYFNSEEIYSLISEIRQLVKREEPGDKISLHTLVIKIFKTIKLKKKNLYECYDNIINIIGYSKM